MHYSKKNLYISIIVAIMAVSSLFFFLFQTQKEHNFLSVKTENPTQKTPTNLWNGIWVLKGSTNFYNSVLTISSSTDRSFNFTIEAFNGNLGSVGATEEGGSIARAIIKGDSAVYVSGKEDSDPISNSPCHLTFTFKKENVISIREEYCGYFEGANLSFDGDYEKDGAIKELTVKTANLFSGKPEAYNAFAKLVGTYADLFDGTVGYEDDFHDTTASFDIGSFAMPNNAIMGSIIMIGADNEIIAAVTDYKNEEFIVRYFTNVPEYKHKLPQRIKEWLAGSDITTIVYQ